MSTLTISDLSWITREDLSDTIKNANANAASSADGPSSSASGLPANMAIVDVRDSDHIGGHIRGSTWVPSSELDFRTPELVRTLREKEIVVFHCALSQQRGPSAALRYLRERRRLEGKEEEGGEKGGEKIVGDEGEGKGKSKGQKVLVLRGGFTEWQEKYGQDAALTEGYQKDIWQFGY